MKKILPFAGFVAALLGIISFILILATNSVSYVNGNIIVDYSGAQGIFGGEGVITDLKANGGAIVAFILLILGILAVAAASVLPLIKKFEKYANCIEVSGAVLLLTAAILIFCEVPMFCGVNGLSDAAKYYRLDAGWVVAGILAILGACVAVVPTVMVLVGKKK